MNHVPCRAYTTLRRPTEPLPIALPLRPCFANTAVGLDETTHLPLIGDGMFYVPSGARGLGAYDLHDGRARWEISVQRRWGACLLDGERLVSMVREGQLWVIDAASGAVIERHNVPPLFVDQGLMANGRLIAPLWDGAAHLAAYDLARRALAWQHAICRPPDFAPALDGSVLVQSDERGIVALDLENGEVRWRYDVTDLGRHVALRRSWTGQPVTSPVLWEGLAIAGVAGHHLVAVDLTTGQARWTRTVEARVPDRLAIDDRGLLHLLDMAALEIFDARTGELVARNPVEPRRTPAGDGPFSGLLLGMDHVITVDRSGQLLAIDRATGRVAQQLALGPVADAPLWAAGKLFIREVSGKLHLLEAGHEQPTNG